MAPGVTYEKMTDYVERETQPIWAHVQAHDAWHRDQLQSELSAARAARRAAVSQWLAAATVLASVLIPFVTR